MFQVMKKTQDEIHNCVLNDKLKPYRPNIFEKLHDCAFFRLWHSPFQKRKGRWGCKALSSILGRFSIRSGTLFEDGSLKQMSSSLIDFTAPT